MLATRDLIWAAAAGALIPIMAILNARLGQVLGSPLHAPVVLFVIGLVIVLAMAVLWSKSGIDLGKLREAHPADLVGGAIVAFYVVSATILAPKIGVGNFIVFAVSAQVISSAAIDHYGMFGAAVRPLTAVKIGGILLLIAGIAITQLADTKSGA